MTSKSLPWRTTVSCFTSWRKIRPQSSPSPKWQSSFFQHLRGIARLPKCRGIWSGPWTGCSHSGPWWWWPRTQQFLLGKHSCCSSWAPGNQLWLPPNSQWYKISQGSTNIHLGLLLQTGASLCWQLNFGHLSTTFVHSASVGTCLGNKWVSAWVWGRWYQIDILALPDSILQFTMVLGWECWIISPQFVCIAAIHPICLPGHYIFSSTFPSQEVRRTSFGILGFDGDRWHSKKTIVKHKPPWYSTLEIKL